MESNKNNVALLVHACDRYQFLYEGFEHFFLKHWDFDVDCNYYFATETETASIHNFKNIKSGSGEWADRLAILLREKITEKYVLYFQEDMWLNKPINAEFFNQLFKLAQQNNWQQIKLHSSDIYKTNATGVVIEGFEVGVLNNEASDYLMSHQITLWNKEFLIKQLHKKEHPWRNERKATKRLKKLNPQIFHVDYFEVNGEIILNNTNINPVLRSEYQTVSTNGKLNKLTIPFIESLSRGSKEQQQYAEKLQYNFSNALTHDGKLTPQKFDIIKWIKTKIFKTKT